MLVLVLMLLLNELLIRCCGGIHINGKIGGACSGVIACVNAARTRVLIIVAVMIHLQLKFDLFFLFDFGFLFFYYSTIMMNDTTVVL